MTGWRLTSSIPAMMRSLSSCFDATRDVAQDRSGELGEEALERSHQAPQRGAHGFVVIDDRDDRRVRQMITLGLGNECGDDAVMSGVT
jgi:hypothetical protein